MGWKVLYSRQAKNISIDIQGVLEALHLDLEVFGPTLNKWPNYGKLRNQKGGADKRHCHLIKNKVTYVACWEVKDIKKKVLEVYYVGTHEKAPY